MRFHERVRQTRLTKKHHDPLAYTQSACGSRMLPEPITQEGWSRYENRETRPDFDTVMGIAHALNEPPDEFLRAAGYPIPNEPERHGEGRYVILQEEQKRGELETIKKQLAEMQATIDRLLSPS